MKGTTEVASVQTFTARTCYVLHTIDLSCYIRLVADTVFVSTANDGRVIKRLNITQHGIPKSAS